MFYKFGLRTVCRKFNIFNGYYRFNFSHLVRSHGSASGYNKKKRQRECLGPSRKAEQCKRLTKMYVEDKVALVIGGTGGIGCAAASILLQKGCKHVAIAGPNSQKCSELARNLNCRYGKDKASGIPLDVRNYRNFEDVFDCVLEKTEALDIVVNSAGIFDEEHWDNTLKTNVEGVIRGTYLAHEVMSKEEGGTGGVIVNISGTMGISILRGAPVYSATKSAIISFSVSYGTASLEKKTGVRVVCLCPGVTNTNMFKSTNKTIPRLIDVFEKEINAAKKQKTTSCAQAMLFLIRHADTGSVWVVEGSQLYELKFPERSTYSKLVASFC